MHHGFESRDFSARNRGVAAGEKGDAPRFGMPLQLRWVPPENHFIAYCRSWLLVARPSLCLMVWRCDSMVLTESVNSCAISRELMPRPIMLRICTSRFERRATGSLVSERLFSPAR